MLARWRERQATVFIRPMSRKFEGANRLTDPLESNVSVLLVSDEAMHGAIFALSCYCRWFLSAWIRAVS